MKPAELKIRSPRSENCGFGDDEIATVGIQSGIHPYRKGGIERDMSKWKT